MKDDGIRHIGDDQLIFGLPKHMAAVAGDGGNAYWEIVPGKDACFTCRMMGGRRFPKRPGPVHPNCACEIRRVVQRERQPRVVADGRLQGYGDTEFKRFAAGQKITVTITNLGPLPAAAMMRVDRTEWRATRYLSVYEAESFEFTKFGDTPMTWELFLIYLGLDGSTIDYEVRG